MRVTKTNLVRSVRRINAYLKENEKDIHYDLDIAYGGYRLIKYTNENGACIDRSDRLSAREMYYVLSTLEFVLIDVFKK